MKHSASLSSATARTMEKEGMSLQYGVALWAEDEFVSFFLGETEAEMKAYIQGAQDCANAYSSDGGSAFPIARDVRV